MDHSEITHLEWCAGYGGVHLGLARVVRNLRLIAASEIESYACANLVAKMEECKIPPAPIWTNLKTFPCAAFRGCVDIFSAGYPCQPFSHAGKRTGSSDPRHLWPFIQRAVWIIRPGLCFFENVEGHLTLGFKDVCHDLDELGYVVTAGIFSAAEVGASHQRKRLFIMAYRKDSARRLLLRLRGSREEGSDAGWGGNELADTLLATGSSEPEQQHSQWPDESGRSGGIVENTGQPKSRRRANKKEIGRQGKSNHDSGASGRMADPSERQLSQPERRPEGGNGIGPTGALPNYPPSPSDREGWERVLAIDPSLEPALCRVAHGSTNRVDRLRLCGNGVVPDVVAKAFVTLLSELLA